MRWIVEGSRLDSEGAKAKAGEGEGGGGSFEFMAARDLHSNRTQNENPNIKRNMAKKKQGLIFIIAIREKCKA